MNWFSQGCLWVAGFILALCPAEFNPNAEVEPQTQRGLTWKNARIASRREPYSARTTGGSQNMSLNYSLIVPYFKTPEITRMSLFSMFHFAAGEPEVIVVDNAPGSPESAMLREFPRIRLIENPTTQRGSYANFEALDIGLAAASHDLVGLLHSDTIFMEPGWDKRWFGRLVNADLAAISTFEREANPFRPARKKMEDRLKHLRHKNRPAPDAPEKLMYHFLLTRRSGLAAIGFNFLRDCHLTAKHFAAQRKGVEILSLVQMSRFLWHTSNITSLMTGQMDDPKLAKSFAQKRERFLKDSFVRKHFAPVLPKV